MKFDRLGVFQYSHEENTHAADTMEDNVPKNGLFQFVDREKINFQVKLYGDFKEDMTATIFIQE